VNLNKLFIVVGVLLVGLACRKSATQTPGAAAPGVSSKPIPQAGSAQPTPAPKPVPATLPDVLARVNGEAILKAEFENAIRSLEAQAGQGIPFEKRDEVYRQVLDQLVGYKLLVQETKNRQMTVTEAEIDVRVGEVKKQFPSEEAFTKVLADRRVTLEAFRQDARVQMLISKIIQAEVVPSIKVTEQDVQTFYDKNRERFNQPEAVQARHILIRFPPNADAAGKGRVRATADAVLKKVMGGGDFAALAKEYSQDSGSAANGGDLGFFVKDQMVPPFAAAAFALQPGQVSSLVETQYGYHIIKVIERRAARVVPLVEARGDIWQFLTAEQQQQKTEAFVNGLKAKAKVEILM